MPEVRHAHPLVEIINELDMNIVAEIGVYGGAITEYILEKCPNIKEYWAIDPWIQYDGYVALQCNESNWQRRFLNVCKLMQRFPQLKVIRDFSNKANVIFSKEYFDLVFIDANHAYEYIKEDIEIWHPLVKKNGVICGHDYSYHWKDHVVKAVNEKFGNEVKRSFGKTWFYGNIGSCDHKKGTRYYEI